MVRALLAVLVLVVRATGAEAQSSVAADASAQGPVATTVADYDLGSLVLNDVLPGCMPAAGLPAGPYDCRVELKARVYRPRNPSGRRPLVVILHGNHGTCGRPYAPPPGGTDRPGLPGNPRIDDRCDYTGTGACPAGYTVTPNWLGYEYLGTRLASYGYVVVSVSANRGINCRNSAPGVDDDWLIRARGRLVLKHLQLLSACNRSGQAGLAAIVPGASGVDECDVLRGHLDFKNVGLFGHSRGGEGVRAAYGLYRDAGEGWQSAISDSVTFKGIFEVGPTDRQRAFVAQGVPWNVLLPMCDGDVSNLWGLQPFDRMLADSQSAQEKARPGAKSTYTVWGANHNFYNTQWQTRDGLEDFVVDGTLPGTAATCTGAGNTPLFADAPGSAAQRLTGLSSVLAFFRAHVGQSASIAFDKNFNPLFDTPGTARDESNAAQNYPQRVDRGYTTSPSASATMVFEDFTKGTGTNTYGSANDTGTNLTVLHRNDVTDLDDRIQRAARIGWTAAAATTFYQTNWASAVSKGRNASAFVTLDFRVARQDDAANPAGNTDFSVQAFAANGTSTGALRMLPYMLRAPLTGPVGAEAPIGLHPVFQTVRIPLADFPDWSKVKGNLRGIRFTFDQTATGAVYLANVQLSRRFGSGVNTLTRPTGTAAPSETPRTLEAASAETGGAPVVVPCTITAVRPGETPDPETQEATVEIELASPSIFGARDQAPVLWAGERTFDRSYYVGGDLHTIVFVLSASDFAALPDGAPASVTYGAAGSSKRWDCGVLPTS